MHSKLFSATLLGLDCHTVEVEVDYRRGLAKFTIVGLADKSVLESKERVISALYNSGLKIIPQRTTINLAPANMAKHGPNFDLAIAIGVLVASGKIESVSNDVAFLGELSLSGKLRPVKGVISLVNGLKKNGFRKVVLPSSNYAQARLVENIELISVENLIETVAYLKQPSLHKNSEPPRIEPAGKSVLCSMDLAQVKGHRFAKRALEIAATGNHSLIFNGIPGSGKTMLASCLPGILPCLKQAESIEVTEIHSLTQGSNVGGLIKQRPFRQPHHSITRSAMLGGGNLPKPGEISLAHKGVLYLDELPLYSPTLLDDLRQPLVTKKVHLAKSKYAVTFPADFMLVASMNPCPCGYFGSTSKVCTCSEYQMRRYRQRISGPLLDRFEMLVNIEKVDYRSFFSESKEETSKAVAQRILSARSLLQKNKFKKANSTKAMRYLESAITKLALSVRAYNSILSISRSIAALDRRFYLLESDVAEALAYRTGG